MPRRSPTSCSPPSPTTSSWMAGTPSTSRTRRSRWSTTWVGNGLPTSCRHWWRRRRRPVAARSGELAVPHDLADMTATAVGSLPERLAAARHDGFEQGSDGVSKLGWSLLSEEPADVVAAIDEAIVDGIDPEQLGRLVAFAAALRITRFHTQNDHGDWDEVHHAFTSAERAIKRCGGHRRPSCCAASTTVRCASTSTGSSTSPPPGCPSRQRASEGADGAELAELQSRWDQEGRRRCRHHHLPVPARRRRSVTGHRNPRSCTVDRGCRVPLVPDLRGGRAAVPCMAGGFGGER